MVNCMVFEELSEKEEAYLFSQQNGISTKPTKYQLCKALQFAGNEEVNELVAHTKTTGLHIDFSNGGKKQQNRIICVATLFDIYRKVGQDAYIDILSIIKATWDGEPESLRKEIINGMASFYTQTKGQFNKKTLIQRLSRIAPIKIVRDGGTYPYKGNLKFAKPILDAYNTKTKNKLVIDFEV